MLGSVGMYVTLNRYDDLGSGPGLVSLRLNKEHPRRPKEKCSPIEPQSLPLTEILCQDQKRHTRFPNHEA